MLLEGYIEFENEIPVTLECLGKEYPITIAGITGVLETPFIFDGFYEEKKLGQLQPSKHGNIKYSDHFDWGSVNSWPHGDSNIRACKILFDHIEERSFEETGNIIALELKKWRSILIDNISLILKEDYRGPRRANVSKSYGLGEFGLFRQNRNSDNTFIPDDFKSTVINLISRKILRFDVDGLKKVLDDTSKGTAPLLPFYFLFDAERAKFEENYRKSVLDSATAVEVCFSFLVSKLLPFENDINKYVSSQNNSLRLKRKLLNVLKVAIPVAEKRYEDDLDIVRNRVIHAGHSPTNIEASTAYEIAKQTLYSLLPKVYEI